jgi:hypothetical protein
MARFAVRTDRNRKGRILSFSVWARLSKINLISLFIEINCADSEYHRPLRTINLEAANSFRCL